MNMGKLRCRFLGHYFHNDNLARTHTQTTPRRTSYIVHMRCIRCGYYVVKSAHAGPVPPTVVSLEQR
jgi:hypothetical protein